MGFKGFISPVCLLTPWESCYDGPGFCEWMHGANGPIGWREHISCLLLFASGPSSCPRYFVIFAAPGRCDARMRHEFQDVSSCHFVGNMVITLPTSFFGCPSVGFVPPKNQRVRSFKSKAGDLWIPH